jgi:hypothetical protein
MLLEPLGDGAVKAVGVGNCCVYFYDYYYLSCFQAVADVAQHPK